MCFTLASCEPSEAATCMHRSRLLFLLTVVIDILFTFTVLGFVFAVSWTLQECCFWVDSWAHGINLSWSLSRVPKSPCSDPGYTGCRCVHCTWSEGDLLAQLTPNVLCGLCLGAKKKLASSDIWWTSSGDLAFTGWLWTDWCFVPNYRQVQAPTLTK